MLARGAGPGLGLQKSIQMKRAPRNKEFGNNNSWEIKSNVKDTTSTYCETTTSYPEMDLKIVHSEWRRRDG
ncbi:unnamed protein product [Danaus chrysippus]|uniref:(African queen) hypothetical protein n=1 Tax=Danaus chrysippus TaxID=151541 RepID=A0A8J2QKW7_9NEOP|nr:unnamed protein product [Danaus chrysippus]